MITSELEVILCDADGNLFDSESHAFSASAEVTNRFLESLGLARRFSAEELRVKTTGKNFRTTAGELAAALGAAPPAPEVIEDWVREEMETVTAHLGATLRPDPEVTIPVTELSDRFGLAVVSSSAQLRVDTCLAAAGLDHLFSADARFSAEDSLPTPRSKPDPAVYELAAARLGVAPSAAVAVEDSVPGVRSAVCAGHPTIGNLQFVPPQEQAVRALHLGAAGAFAVVASWSEAAALIADSLVETVAVAD